MKRRSIGGVRSRTSAGALDLLGARPGHDDTSRGIRSCSSSSVASTIGSAWNRSTISVVVEHVAERDQRHPLVVRHVALDDRDRRALRETARGVVERLAEPVPAGGPGLASSRRSSATAAFGSTIAASAVAYGATTTSSLSPRFSPRPGTPKLEY